MPRMNSRSRLIFVSLLALSAVALLSWALPANAEPNGPYKTYAQWVPKRKGGPFPDRADSLQIVGAPSPAYQVFWLATRRTESSGRHFRSDGLPLAGYSDNGPVLSIGYSQARFDGNYGVSNFRDAKPYSPFLSNLSWDFNRYLWDPTYNAAIGNGIYTRNMRNRGNNPCLAYAEYNGGPGGANNYQRNKFQSPSSIKKHVSNFVANARRLAGPHANEVEKIIQTTPGCSGTMEDVDPVHTPSAVVSERAEIYVPGFCDPEAAKMLREGYQRVQKDRDETLEPLLRTIKTMPVAGAGAGAGSGSSSGGAPGGSGGAPGGGSGGASSVYSDSVSQLSSCVSLSWPNVKFQYPTMDELLKAAEKELVQRACSAAREKVAEAKSSLTGQFYFNPRVPGVQPAGVSVSGSGGAPPQ